MIPNWLIGTIAFLVMLAGVVQVFQWPFQIFDFNIEESFLFSVICILGGIAAAIKIYIDEIE